MYRTFSSFILTAFILLMVSCQSDDKKTNSSSTSTKTTSSAASNGNKVDIKKFLAPRLKDAAVVEYIFYLGQASMSTETDAKEQIANYIYYVTDDVSPVTNCKYDVASAFRNGDGEFVLEMDVALGSGCEYVRLRADGETHYQKLNEAGVNFFKTMANAFTQQFNNQMQAQQGGQ